ncbi:MAG: hypothetical protein J6S13_03115 [Clostridia bacterium]|nr:hypothetical protein [Clostridia bacterium]
MSDKPIENNYKKNPDLNVPFNYNGETCHVELKPFTVLVLNDEQKIKFTTRVKSYCDCFAFLNGVLYFGTRVGELFGYHIRTDKRVCCMFIDNQAQDYLEETYRKNPMLQLVREKRLTGYYPDLPEINAMNAVVEKNAITRLAVYQNYILAADLSGRISMIDTISHKRIKSFKVEGAVSLLKVNGNKLYVEYVVDNYIPDPEYMEQIKEAFATSFDLQ